MMCIGKLGKFIASLCEESRYSYPFIVQYWHDERNEEEFHQLMLEDTADPQYSYSTFDSQIKEKAIQMVIKNK